MTPEEVLQFAKKHGAKMVDFKFVDLPGTWQHFSVPMHELKEETFVEGVPFDGSSIRGFQTINESDMLIIPDPTTAIMDPFTAAPTQCFSVKDQVHRELNDVLPYVLLLRGYVLFPFQRVIDNFFLS